MLMLENYLVYCCFNGDPCVVVFRLGTTKIKHFVIAMTKWDAVLVSCKYAMVTILLRTNIISNCWLLKST